LLAGLSEYLLFRDRYTTKLVTYDNLDLIHPDRWLELNNDLNTRFGIKEIITIKVGRIDTTKKSARIQIAFKDTGENHIIDEYV
jgi:hypothetical protein